MDKSRAATGLDAVIRQGALRRKHFYFQQVKASLPATAAACFSAFAVYILTMVIAGRSDWPNIFSVAVVSAVIPLVAISLLILGGRRTHPFSMSLAVIMFAACFAISAISALRIPTSYLGLLFTLPFSLFFVTLANVTMVRQSRDRVALLFFPNARIVEKLAGWALPVILPEEVDTRFRRILIDPETHHHPQWSSHLARLYLRGFEIEPWPTYLESRLGRVDVDTFDIADVSYTSSQIVYYKTKRLLDVLIVVLSFPLVILICIFIALYIFIIDGGSPIFVQERRGYAGTSFKLYKFRTMYRGNHVGSTAAGDSRIMPGCGFLRQTRLDELPQIINILRGDMSIIGPRPVSIPVAEYLEANVPMYFNRHILVPGLTGWAQVSQGYAETADEEIEKLAFDLYYLKHVSLDLDIIIIFRTVRTIFLRLGAR